MYLTIGSIALSIQTKLNTIAKNLYTATTIDKKVVFRVTADYQEYYKLTEMEYAVGDEIPYTPVLLRTVFSTMENDFDSGFNLEDYTLSIFGYEADKVALETILNKYTYDENANDREVISTWIIKKATSRPQFIQNYTDTSGENKPRAEYLLSFSWSYQLGGILSDDVDIKIDGVSVNYIGLEYTSDKLTIPNVAYGSANTLPIGATGYTLSLTLPIQLGNAKHLALFEDMTSKKYNQSYTVVMAFSTFKTLTYSMTLKGGVMNYVRDQIVSFTLTFEEALPRTVVTIDSVVVPVLSFSMVSNRILTDGLATNIDTKYEVKNVDMQWIIRFAYIGTTANTKSLALMNAIMSSSFYDTSYTLGITVLGQTARTYTVVLANGNYSFEQTGELMMECTFVLKAGI